MSILISDRNEIPPTVQAAPEKNPTAIRGFEKKFKLGYTLCKESVPSFILTN
jgi:hypothetical protein